MPAQQADQPLAELVCPQLRLRRTRRLHAANDPTTQKSQELVQHPIRLRALNFTIQEANLQSLKQSFFFL